MSYSAKTSRKLQMALGVAAVASSLGSTASALAGPTLSNLVNLTNTGEVTVNNVLGQSFSVNGILTSAITPFAANASATLVQVAPVTFGALTGMTLGLNAMIGAAAGTFNVVVGQVTSANILGVVQLGQLSAISLAANSSIQTIGASIQNTVFGPSTVRATSSFTNQTTTSLTAF